METNKEIKSKVILEKANLYLFLSLLLFVLIARITLLFTFNFKFIGSDDLTFWQMLNDYSKGIFREPYFYGQNYNFGLEALLAVPLNWLNIPMQYSLPVISSLMGMTPFIVFSTVLFKRKYYSAAYGFLLILLAMPIEYDIISSITRGFTSGLFLSSLLIFPLLKPNTKQSFWLLGIAIGLGYILNPNSLVFAFPVGMYLFLKNYKNKYFYAIVGLFLVAAFSIEILAKRFYTQNPEYIVHSMWDLKFYFYLIKDSLLHLDKAFRHLTPGLWFGNWIVLLMILGLGIYTLRKDKFKGISVIAALGFIILTLGFNKIHDDIGVIFLSTTRMFLGVPLLLGLALFWSDIDFAKSVNGKRITFGFAFIFLILKLFFIPNIVEKHTEEKAYGPIAIKVISDFESDCFDLGNHIIENNADLVVFIPNWEYSVPELEFYNYGCPLITENVNSTILNLYERRTWVYTHEYSAVRNNILFFNLNLDSEEDFKIVSESPKILLLEDNTLTLSELAGKYEFDLARNNY